MAKMLPMDYESPFGEIYTGDHNGPDALCLLREHCTHADRDTLAEFHQAAIAVIERRAPQPSFFLARHLAELSLKALHDGGHPHTHSLTRLLDSLQRQGHALLAGGAEEDLVVAFIRDLDSYDEGGDQASGQRDETA